MFLTWGAGAPRTWAEQTRRRLVHFTSPDLEQWEFRGRVDVGSENVIDAAFAVVADGRPRLWFKDEVDGSTTWSAVWEETDGRWRAEGQVIGLPAHEGPNVFRLGGWYWMVVDEWRGQAVHRSADGLAWTRQEANNGLILDAPGAGADDATYGRHADVVTQGDHAYISTSRIRSGRTPKWPTAWRTRPAQSVNSAPASMRRGCTWKGTSWSACATWTPPSTWIRRSSRFA